MDKRNCHPSKVKEKPHGETLPAETNNDEKHELHPDGLISIF